MRTSLSLCNTYILFQGQYYEQIQGAAMGPPVSPVEANLYMEFFGDRALTTAVKPPRLWKFQYEMAGVGGQAQK